MEDPFTCIEEEEEEEKKKEEEKSDHNESDQVWDYENYDE